MQEPESEISSGADASMRILGFRIAVGLVGLVLLIMSFMLGSVAMKQSATNQALEDNAAIEAPAEPASVQPDRYP
jgi:hypothetical protein